MRDFMRLADGTEFEIENGASLGNIIHDAADEADALRVSKAVTKENVAHVEFFSKTDEDQTLEPTGVYDDLALDSVYYDVENMKVLISLHEKSDVEKRLDAIESEQEMQNEAIDFLAME